MIPELKKELVSKIERENILTLLKMGKRLDGRTLLEQRSLKIVPNLIEKADGSAYVELGKTKVLVGVKVSLAKPFPDLPDKGVFVVNAEFNPIASPFFELGPPSDYAVEIARIVDRAIRSSEMINLDELAIIPGKLVWMLNIDIYAIDDDGNLIDAAMYGAVSAILSGTLPKVEIIDEEKEEIEIIKEERVPIPTKDFPVTFTFARIGDYLILDPVHMEENLMNGRLTIAINNKNEICTIQKGEGGGFKLEDILKAKDVAIQKADELRNKIANQIALGIRGEDSWLRILEG